MPVTEADLVVYGAVNRAADDVSTVGGAVDTASRPLDSVLGSNSDIEFVSDGADTRSVTVEYRDSTGAIQTDVVVLNGLTPVALGAVVERILDVEIASADGTRTVTMRIISNGGDLHTFGPNETNAHRVFREAASEEVETKFYAKLFFRNNHPTLALTTSSITLTLDASNLFRIFVEGSKDSSTSEANRRTEPAGASWVDDGVPVSVPTGNLGPGESIGFWVEMTLAAGEAAAKPSFTVELDGQTIN